MVCQACNARTLCDAAVQTDESRLHEPSVEALRMRAYRKRKKQREESVMYAQFAVRNAQKGVAQATKPPVLTPKSRTTTAFPAVQTVHCTNAGNEGSMSARLV
eukprot:6193664-Pleurochrysis_carterae.AAC.1